MLSMRLMRFGAKKKPSYRIVVMDSRTPRDGKVLEEVGLYHPIEVAGKQVSIKGERVQEWIGKGATPSAMVRKLLNLVKAAAK